MPNIPSSASSMQPKKRKLTSNIEKIDVETQTKVVMIPADEKNDDSSDGDYEVEDWDEWDWDETG